MLPADTLVMRKRILSFSLADLKEKAEAILKTFQLFVYGDVY
jgi:hypothetical protein